MTIDNENLSIPDMPCIKAVANFAAGYALACQIAYGDWVKDALPHDELYVWALLIIVPCMYVTAPVTDFICDVAWLIRTTEKAPQGSSVKTRQGSSR